ncbi:MAG: hypothetical protein ACTSXL_03215 [Alphaproteobacteria bacterium]
MQKILLLSLMLFSLGIQAIPSNQLFILGQEKTMLLKKNKELKAKNTELKKIRNKLKKHVKGFGIATGILAGTTATTFIAGASAKNKKDVAIADTTNKADEIKKQILVQQQQNNNNNNNTNNDDNNNTSQKVKVCRANAGIKNKDAFVSKMLVVGQSYKCDKATMGNPFGQTSCNCYIGNSRVAKQNGAFSPTTEQVGTNCEDRIKAIAKYNTENSSKGAGLSNNTKKEESSTLTKFMADSNNSALIGYLKTNCGENGKKAEDVNLFSKKNFNKEYGLTGICSQTQLPGVIAYIETNCSTLTELDISKNGLTELPANLPSGLLKLYVYENYLTELPANLPSGLEHLLVSDNQLTSLPANLPSGLEHLLVSDNQLTSLPANFPNNYGNLIHIDIIDNPSLKSYKDRLEDWKKAAPSNRTLVIN